MEPTLVRNLSDHRGNNLLHVLAGSGNADALAWLCSSFGPEMQDALLDENKRGLTPVVAAIQVRPSLFHSHFLIQHFTVFIFFPFQILYYQFRSTFDSFFRLKCTNFSFISKCKSFKSISSECPLKRTTIVEALHNFG